MSQNIIIQRLYVEVDADATEVNHQRADDMMQLLKERLLPELERLLADAFVGQEGKRVQIDKLQLDLGEIDQHNVAEALVKAVSEHLPDRLREREEEKPVVSEIIESPAGEERAFELWLHFINTGALPWWASATESLADQKETWLVTLTNNEPVRRRWRKVLQSSVRHCERWFYQTGKDGVRAILLDHPEALALWLEFEKSHQSALTALAAPRRFPAEILLGILNRWEDAPAGNSSSTVTAQVSELSAQGLIILHVQQHLGWSAKLVQQLIEEFEKPDHKEISVSRAMVLAEKVKAANQNAASKQSAGSVINEEVQPNQQDAQPKFVDDVINRLFKLPSNNPPEDADEAVYVGNAGLALVSPFIPLLLKGLELTDGKAFVNEAARLQAVYYLHYLACGEVTATEDQLYLPKVLCDWPADEVLPDFTITDTAQVDLLLEEMLDAIRDRWSPMKSSGWPALRSGFLQRPGKLVQDYAGHWSLTVEPHGTDALLQFINWSIYVIRFPWMKEMMYVEWNG